MQQTQVSVYRTIGPLVIIPNFTRNLKDLKCFFVTMNGIRIVGIPTKCKKMIQSCLVCSAKYCIILLPFQLKTKRKNQHCCTYWLTKKRLKQNKKISGLYCGTMLGCTPEIWYPSVPQAIVSTVWYSTALKFEIFPSVWICFSTNIIL